MRDYRRTPPPLLSALLGEGVARARQVRMERERRGEGVARFGRRAFAEEDLGEVQHGGEVARLQLERAPDVVQAFDIAPEEVVERGALVPSLGIGGRGAQQRAEARLGDVVALGGNVARRRVERRRRRAVRMMHPY